MYGEVRRLLAENALGELKLVKAYFGSPQLHIARSVEKALGGGALLDIGLYCLQFVLMVFNGERPKSIQAMGTLLDTGRIYSGTKGGKKKKPTGVIQSPGPDDEIVVAVIEAIKH